MAYVQTFDRSMIESSLRSASLRFLRDDDGDFIVQFGYDSATDCEINIGFDVSGNTHSVYSIHGTSDKRIPRNDWGRVVMMCNTWNKERRWPKAFLYTRNPGSDATATIVLEENLDLDTGIHQELLDDFTLTTISGILQFWKWAHQEQGL